MPRSRIALVMLGDFSLTVDGRVVIGRTWPRRTAAAVLKLVGLAAERAVHREVLMDRVWPDLAPAGAANQLYKSLHAVRAACRRAGVADPILTVSGQVVRLSAAVQVDVAVYAAAARDALAAATDEARLRMAIDAYAGDLLPDDPFSDWADAPREELRTLHRRLVLALADVLDARGDGASAANMLEGLLRDEPWVEEVHQRLVRLHLAAGRRAEALRQVQACREALRRELGVDPGPETEELARAALELGGGVAVEDGPAGRLPLVEQLADLERRTGDVRRSAGLYVEALGLARQSGDARAMVRLCGKAALSHILDGDMAGGAALLDDLRRQLAAEAPGYVTARTYYLLAQLRWHSGRFREALDAAERSLDAARATGDAVQRAQSLAVMALACHSLGDWRRGMRAEMERQALDVPDGFDVAEAFEGHVCLWEYHLYGDQPYPAVAATVRSLLAQAESAGNRRATALSLLAMGSILFLTGRWTESQQALERSLALADAVGAEQVAVQSQQRLGLLETSRGALAAGRRRLRLALDRASRSSSRQVQSHSRPRILASLARNRLQAGELDDAMRALDHARLVQEQVGECVTCDSLLHPTAVPVLLATGRPARARAAADRAERSASSFRSRGWAAAATHAHGLVAAATGDRAGAQRRLTRSARAFEQLGQPFDQARSLEALAAVMASDGAVAQSNVVRRRGRRLLRGIGAAAGSDRLDLVLGSGEGGGKVAARRLAPRARPH